MFNIKSMCEGARERFEAPAFYGLLVSHAEMQLRHAREEYEMMERINACKRDCGEAKRPREEGKPAIKSEEPKKRRTPPKKKEPKVEESGPPPGHNPLSQKTHPVPPVRVFEDDSDSEDEK